MGAEDGENFIPFSEMNLPGKNHFLNHTKLNNTALEKLKKVRGATVNKVLGDENSISKFKNNFNVDIESMEGAAFMLACEEENVNYIQIRSISNYVERRNKENWDIPLALSNLTDFLINFLNL